MENSNDEIRKVEDVLDPNLGKETDPYFLEYQMFVAELNKDRVVDE